MPFCPAQFYVTHCLHLYCLFEQINDDDDGDDVKAAFHSPPGGRGVEYRDVSVCVCVCMSVCLSAREHISGRNYSLHTNLSKFSVHVACGRGSAFSGGVAVRYVLSVL